MLRSRYIQRTQRPVAAPSSKGAKKSLALRFSNVYYLTKQIFERWGLKRTNGSFKNFLLKGAAAAFFFEKRVYLAVYIPGSGLPRFADWRCSANC